jgi:membrane-associated phospholipid phosphatase
MQLLAFFIFPVRTSVGWREYKLDESISTRFPGLIQRYDAPSNSFPSMHLSVATLTALHLYNNLKPFVGQYAILVFLFPILIATSSLCTKQHYSADVLAGAIVGYVNDKLFEFYW